MPASTSPLPSKSTTSNESIMSTESTEPLHQPLKQPSAQKPEQLLNEGGIVIIGAGMAGSRLAIQLATAFESLKNETERPQITLISKEVEVGYNRIMLSPVLAGETAFNEIYLYKKSDYEYFNINIIAGVSVESIDTKQRTLTLSNQQDMSYTKLVFATGSTARVIPFPNHNAKGVHVFRDVSDVNILSDYAKQGKTGLVIGGGVLGLEAACALKVQGADMTVIHVDDFVLNRQLDLPAATLLQGELARRGVGLELSAMSTTIEVNEVGEVAGLSLKDGRTLPADFIVMAVGIIPNTQLAASSGIEVNRGIVVDEFMQTSCDDVYAIGECVELAGELFGMVSSVNQHIDTLVSVLTQSDNQAKWLPFVSQPLVLKLKVSGIAVFSAGQVAFDDTEQADIETIVYQQIFDEHYQCLYLKNNRLVGTVLYGDVIEGGFYSQLINEQTDVSSFKEDLIYGAAYCDISSMNETGDGYRDSERDIGNIENKETLLDSDDVSNEIVDKMGTDVNKEVSQRSVETA